MKKVGTLRVSAATIGLVVAGLYAAPAAAQATRTWVSGVGDDANPCSRTAPCKTFAGAISKTAPAGEINCLDPGGFGGVTITKAISIVCQYTEGGVLVAGAGVNGIVINAPAASPVYLRGLDIFGAGSAQNGVRFIAGASLTIEDSIIRGFNASNGLGVSFQPSGGSRLFITNTTISNNGTGATGGGVLIQPTGAGGSGRFMFVNVRIQANASFGLKLDTTGNTSAAGILGSLENVQISQATTGIAANTPIGNSGLRLMINNAAISETSTALSATGPLAGLLVANTTIVNNTLGVSSSGGAVINTYNNNRVDGNDTDGNFTLPALPPS
jgi:hypothetical protein